MKAGLDRAFRVDVDGAQFGLQTNGPRRGENQRGINRFDDESLCREASHIVGGAEGAKPEKGALFFLSLHAFGDRRLFPALAVEFVERDAAPTQIGGTSGAETVDAYVHENLVTGF